MKITMIRDTVLGKEDGLKGESYEVEDELAKILILQGKASEYKKEEQPYDREELESRAKELGIEFKSNIGNKKLAELIAAKEKTNNE